MNVSSIDQTELDSTRDEDNEWLVLREESLLFNEAFICSKFNDLDQEEEENEEDEEDASHPPKDDKALEEAHKLIGLVEVEEVNFKKNAIYQWAKELIEESLSPRDSSSSFLSLVRKRLDVQQRLHKAYVRERERHRRTKATPPTSGIFSDDEDKELEKTVPVVVRLGVLTLFPLIESLSAIKDVNYSKLCKQVLDILQQVMATLPPLALHNEPDDCLNAFQDFIYSLIKNNDFLIDSDEKSQAVLALVGVAISRGNAKDLLLVVDVLFNIYKKMGKSSFHLKIGSYLKQLVDYRKDQDLCALFERGFLGSWNLNLTTIEPSSGPTTKLDMVTSDGNYLYIHTYQKGIRKIGTGYGGTIKGHLYGSSNYRPNDKQTSFACIQKKLYYLLPQTSGEIIEGKEEDVRLQVAIIDCLTLKEEKTVVLKEKGSKSYLVSDGLHLYLLSRQQKNSEKEEQSESDKYVVEIFDPHTMQQLKSIELGAIKETKELSIPPTFWDKISVYTTGYQLGILIPDNTNNPKCRVFSLIDGKFLADENTRTEHLNSCICYDSVRNLFWFYDEGKVETWKNLSPAPKHTSVVDTPADQLYPNFSPESILQHPDYEIKDTVEPLQGLLVILASMDRLARQHPIYGERTVPEMFESVSLDDYLYCVETDKKFFELIHSVVYQTLECELPEETKAYVILTCMRLLKVNIHEVADSERSLQELGLENAPILKDIREMLNQFIEKPPLANVGEISRLIQSEASSALTLGFLILHGPTSEGRVFVLQLLKDAATLSPGKQEFLQILLTQFADWDDVTDVLIESEQNKDANSKEDAMDVDASDKHRISQELLEALVTFAFHESVSFVKSSHFETAPVISPALRLLLILQRDIISNPANSSYLVPFVKNVLGRCTELVQVILQSHQDKVANGSLDNVLKSSLIGCIPQSLITALGRKKFVSDLNFARTNLPHIMAFLQNMDKLNQTVPSIAESDERYLRRSLNAKKDKRVVVESKHPYQHGKNQFKQTVTIPGAEALSLHFDSRSRTVSTSSDILQLFKSPTVSDPVVSSKDGKSLIFSGMNWPKQSVLIPGNSVTFVFSAGTRPDKSTAEGNRLRWGFKCRVTGITPSETYTPLIDHWLLDLECTLALVGSKYSATLIEGQPLGAQEKRVIPWLEATLLNGGLEEGEGNPSERSFLEDYIHRQGEAAPLCAWMEKHAGRRVLSVLSKAPLELTERYVVASMLKQLCMVEEAREFAQALKTGESSIGDSINRSKFASLAQESGKITMGLQQKGQAENEWRIAVQEKQNFETFYNYWREEKKEKLMEVCDTKGVEFDSQDEKATIKNLFDKLQDDIAKGVGSSGNKSEPYEVVSKLVIERAKLLLRMRPARRVVAPPSSESPNPFAVHRDKPLTSSVPDSLADSPTTLRSSSYFPKTENTISKEAKQARAEQKTKAFKRRLKELRKWLQAYKSWKQWQEGALETMGRSTPAPPRSPLHAVASFVQSSLSTQELEELLRVHVERAKSRVEGLQYYRQILCLVSFHSTRHQVLGSLGSPFSAGGHYLENIPTCGLELTTQVANAFYPVFEEIVKILGNKNADNGSKLLALIICGVAYHESDVDLLRTAKIFPLLQNIITECNQKILLKLTKPTTTFKDPMEVDKKKTDKEKEDDRKRKEEKEQEEVEELGQIRRLRSSAWLAFRLLATRCVAWEGEVDDMVLQTEALKELQDQIFELMCSELKAMSQKMDVDTEEGGEQCFELLSLLCLLGGSGKGYKSLSREENLMNLISILKTPATQPRAKRLALRLCRRLLTAQSKEAMPKLIEFFLDEIGNRIFSDKKNIPPGPVEDDTKEELTMDTEDLEEDEEGSDEDEDFEEEQYSIYLNTWTQNFQRLIEVCHNAMGPEFFGQSNSGFFDRHTIESRVQQVLQEVSSEGTSLLKTTTLANCNTLAASISSLGGTVTIVPSPVSPAEGKGGAIPNRNKRIQRKSSPVVWTTGQVAHGLASEYIYILRQLLDPRSASPVWSEGVKNILTKSLLELPSVLSGSASQEQARAPLAALCVLGGFSETIRVGGTVVLTEAGDTKKRAIVIDLDPHLEQAEVILETDSSKTPRKVLFKTLAAVPEADLEPSLFPLSVELLKSLLAPLNMAPNDSPQWFIVDLKSRALKVLSHLLGNPLSTQMFLQTFGDEYIPLLVQLANACEPSARQSSLEQEALTTLENLWNTMTRPAMNSDGARMKTMADVLPHFAHSHMAELLPTSWQTNKLQGFIFRGEDKRKLEFVGFEPNLLGRRSYIGRMAPNSTEVLIMANASIPTHLPEFYFEIFIDKTESNSSLISLGFVPEGSRNWGNGSYKYQANAKKTTFVGGSRRQHDYGTHYRAKSTVGCGWNKEEKTIFFTKDGVDQGPAFTNVNFNKMIPAIGVSRGVHLTINFGQEPFKFKLVVEGESPEEREKRKKEEEERRKKEQEEEAERRKKEKEDEMAANILEAQPLVNMGFSLQQAIIALRETGHSGPEAASNWLVENPNFNFDEEAEEKEEQKEEVKEEEKESDKKKEDPMKVEEKVGEQFDGATAEKVYNINSSQTFFLQDNFSYNDETIGKDQPGARLTGEWEESVIPAIRSFMEKDGFSPFEVEEYLQQIRTQLGSNNEQQARGIVMQIVGDAGIHVPFPSASTSSRSEKPPLKMEEVKSNSLVTIAKQVPTDVKHWVSAMDKTKGMTGIVKAVDHHHNLVLVQFYNPEMAALNEWWYSIKLLERSDLPEAPSTTSHSLDSLHSRLVRVENELTGVYARKTVLSLLAHSSLSADGPLGIKDALRLLAQEEVPSQFLLFPAGKNNTSHLLRVFRQRLLALFESGNVELLTQQLLEDTVKYWESCTQLDHKATTVVTSTKPPPVAPEHVRVEGARSLLVIFDRAGTSIPSNSQGSISFYADEGCTNLLSTYVEKGRFIPFSAPSSELWVKVNCAVPTHRNNIKYKFSVVPLHPSLGIAFWLAEFLLRPAFKFIPNFPLVCKSLFNVMVDYIYTTSAPSLLKESIFYLIGEIIQASKGFPPDQRLPLVRLMKLRDELVGLYEVEKNRDTLLSSYIQSLTELMVVVKVAEHSYGENVLFAGEDPMEVEKPLDKDEETLRIAMALATSFKEVEQKFTEEEKKETVEEEPVDTTKEDPMEGEDDELAQALALSLVENEQKPAEQKEEETKDEEKEESDKEPKEEETEEKAEEFGVGLIFDDDMDEETRAALALSLQDSKPEEDKSEKEDKEEQKGEEKEGEKEQKEEKQPEDEFPFSGFTFGSPPSPGVSFGRAKAPSKRQTEKRAKRERKKKEMKPLELPWLKSIFHVKQMLDSLLHPLENEATLQELIRNAWNSTAKGTIKDRVILVDNLPLVDAERAEEMEAAVKRNISDVALVKSVSVPVDDTLKKLKGFAFVELKSHQKMDHVIKKFHRHKLKAPNLVDDIPNLRASLRESNLPRGILQVSKLTELERNNDPRVADFLRGKLVRGKDFTPEMKNALVEIFNSFGGEKEGALVAEQLNELQLISNGKPLTPEQIDFAFKQYKTKQVGEKKEPGLTLEGFLDLYLGQCHEAPSETWEELDHLGYDLHLEKNRFIRFEDALKSQKQWTLEMDSQLSEHVRNVATESEISSSLFLSLDHLEPFTSANAMAHPQLAKVSITSLRLRFQLLKDFNRELASAFPFINFDRSHPSSLASLLSHFRGLIFHSTKFEFIYHVLEKTSVSIPQPSVTIDRLKMAARKEKSSGETLANHTMFGIAFQQLRNTNPRALRQAKPGGTEPHFSIKIVFKGENVQGEGGPYRQFFTDVSKELQGILPLFIPCPNAQQGLGENRDKWIIAPSADSPTHISMFEFLGQLMGLAIRTGVLLILDLPPFFWKPIVGLPTDSGDLMLIDESVNGTLKYVSECTPEEFERDIDETFTTFLSDKTKVPLVKGGENIKVTDANRGEYVRLVEKARLNESHLQVAALRRGVGDTVPIQLLNLCTWKDIEWKVCGEPRIDVNLLRRHTTCSGLPSDAPHVGYFWQTLQEFSQQDRRGFLRFVWAQERLPVNDEEFERTKTRMMIKPFSGLTDPNSAFPKADTCFFNIMLPEYTSQRILRERLLYAIYTDSHSMNADEPQEDELATVNGRGRPPGVFDYSSESDSEE